MGIKLLVISNYEDYHSTRPEASIFKGLAHLGFDITVMTNRNSKHSEEFEAEGIETIDFHPEKKFDRSEVARIRKVLIDKKIQIAHFFNSPSTVNGIRAAKGLPVKVVLYRGFAGHIHWYDPTAYIKYLHPRVDKIFCNSIGVENYLRRQLIFGKDKAITINKGHNVDWYADAEPYDIRGELGIPKDTFLMINVANNRKMKGIPYLLEAFNQLPSDLPIHLLLLGNNMDDEQNMEIIKAGGKADKIHLLGFRKNALNIVSATNAFILSSLYGESITKSVIESMSLGVPAVITDIPGNVELIEDNVSGLRVPSKDSQALAAAMLRIFEDQPLYEKLKVNCKKHIQTKLGYKQTIEKTKAMYEGLLSGWVDQNY